MAKNNQEEYLQELFTLPFRVYPVAELSGEKIYGSDKLKRKFIEVLDKKLKDKKIISLVVKDKIIPCWVSKGILSLTKFKIFAPTMIKQIRAFYESNVDKIFILLDTNTFFGYISNNWIVSLTLHELQHMAVKSTRWLRIAEKILIPFYYFYWKEVLQVKKQSDKLLSDVKIYINHLYNVERSIFKDRFEKVLIANKDFIRKRFSKYNSTIAKRVSEDITNLVYLFLTNDSKFLKQYYQNKQIIAPLYKSYRFLGSKAERSTLAIQELFAPSEVCAVLSESQYSKNPVLKKIVNLI